MPPRLPRLRPKATASSAFDLMPRVLHILTRPSDDLAAGILAETPPEAVVVDLTAPDPDYAALLDEIFKADSVQVW